MSAEQLPTNSNSQHLPSPTDSDTYNVIIKGKDDDDDVEEVEL